ncbi:hypothetical protein N0V93_007561 [Gnomoniopsis smithogilvyi]|uniref:DUF7730 domain-containing protein n=1 Tax=Gnomoniopsis smithogilvyi TaxID=1191159 RepID=A0A9W8YTX0_9PEZI|nr:hypothetical protein N0V93_007561 [Gnomoniopsis smithogilvyi]
MACSRLTSFACVGKRRRTIVDYREDGDDDEVGQWNNDDDGEWGKPPAEIRNLIYEECLDQKGGSYCIGKIKLRLGRMQAAANGLVWHGGQNLKKIRVQRSINIGLLQTNKAIHTEAAPLLYRHPFKFLAVHTLQLFLLRLKPATISHLQHIDLEYQTVATVGRYLPVALALLSPAANIRFLRVPSIEGFPHGPTGFDRRLGPVPWGVDMTVADWDTLVGRNMAKEVYTYMFPFLAKFLRNPERKEDQAGSSRVSQLLSTIRVFEEALLDGPQATGCSGLHMNCIKMGRGHVIRPSSAIVNAPWTPARREAMREAMGQEIQRLVEVD